MNIQLDESTQPPTITSAPIISVNFELGPIIKSTKLKGHISIYGSESMSGTQFATLNMAKIGYALNSGFVKYMNDTFLKFKCSVEYNKAIAHQVYVCPANGKVVPGMPGIVIDSRTDGEIYEFESADYFILPTVKKYTQAAKAIYGVNLVVPNTDSSTSKLQMGMLFVQKYGLRIEYIR